VNLIPVTIRAGLTAGIGNIMRRKFTQSQSESQKHRSGFWCVASRRQNTGIRWQVYENFQAKL